VRIAVGPKDLENGTLKLQEETLTKEVVAKDSITSYVRFIRTDSKDLFEKHWITEIPYYGSNSFEVYKF
jgi:hypothetical protein